MKESKNYICYKHELERLLCSVTGEFIFNGEESISKQAVVEFARKFALSFKQGQIISNSLKNSPEWWILTLSGLIAGLTVIVYPNEKSIEDILTQNSTYGVDKAFFSEKDVREAMSINDIQDHPLPYNGKIVLFTSGTQSTPKGVVIEMDNYVPNLIGTQERLHMTPTDVNVGSSPYSHAMGFMYSSCDFFFGGTFVICRNQLEFTNLIVQQKANIACMQPIYFEGMINLDKFVKAVAKMRYVLVGGAPISKPAYEFYYKSGAKIINGYGMTECVAGIAITDSVSNFLNDRSLDIMSSSNIKILSDGEILVSGPTVCRKYINGDSIPDENGWYHTHDVGYFKDGRLYVTGRKDNVIVCENGYKISLEGVEDKLLKNDIIESCLVEYINKCLIINVVSILEQTALNEFVDSCLDYYERPFRVNKVEKIEVQNGKKLRKRS